MKRHAQIDIESLGTEAGYAVMSIGVDIMDIDVDAEREDVTATPVSSAYIKLDLNDVRNRGYLVDTSTRAWWAVQNDEAKQVMQPDSTDINLYDGLIALHRILNCKVDFFWSNGAMDFDMLTYMYHKEMVLEPWNHWQLRNLRNTLDLVRDDTYMKPQRDTVAHDALGDAVYQNAQLTMALRQLYAVEPLLVQHYTGAKKHD